MWESVLSSSCLGLDTPVKGSPYKNTAAATDLTMDNWSLCNKQPGGTRSVLSSFSLSRQEPSPWIKLGAVCSGARWQHSTAISSLTAVLGECSVLEHSEAVSIFRGQTVKNKREGSSWRLWLSLAIIHALTGVQPRQEVFMNRSKLLQAHHPWICHCSTYMLW